MGLTGDNRSHDINASHRSLLYRPSSQFIHAFYDISQEGLISYSDIFDIWLGQGLAPRLGPGRVAKGLKKRTDTSLSLKN